MGYLNVYHTIKKMKPLIILYFVDTVGLVDRINISVSSNFIGMVSSFSVIFYIGANNSCSFNKGALLKLKKNMFPRNIEGVAKGLEI